MCVFFFLFPVPTCYRCVLLANNIFLCSNIVYILYIIVSMSSLYLRHLVMRIKIYYRCRKQ
jgi:hypothetical protein